MLKPKRVSFVKNGRTKLLLIQAKATKQAASDVQERIDGAVEQFFEEHSVDNVLAEKPKKQRKPRAKKEQVAA